MTWLVAATSGSSSRGAAPASIGVRSSGGAGVDALAELAHRPCRPLHDDHDDRRDEQHQRRLARQGVQQQLARQRLAQLQRLGHLHRGHALAVDAGHRLPQHGHAHRVAAELVVVEVHQRGVDVLRRQLAARRRQVVEAGHHLATEAADAEVQAAAVVGLEGLERRVGHVGAHLRCVAAAHQFEQFADRLGGGQQGAVVGRVGRLEGLAVEQHRVDGHEGADRDQDAREQAAPQRRAADHGCALSR